MVRNIFFTFIGLFSVVSNAESSASRAFLFEQAMSDRNQEFFHDPESPQTCAGYCAEAIEEKRQKGTDGEKSNCR